MKWEDKPISTRGMRALNMRRNGETYRAIASELGISEFGAYALVNRTARRIIRARALTSADAAIFRQEWRISERAIMRAKESS